MFAPDTGTFSDIVSSSRLIPTHLHNRSMNRTRYAATALLVSAIVTLFGYIAGAPDAYGQGNDTLHVNAFDKYLWTYWGRQDRWVVFPNASNRYERILMRYMLTCPNPTCGEWDYTTNVYLRHHTGRIDSALKDAPSFTVDGGTRDSLHYRSDTTYTYAWNATTRKTDTTANPRLTVLIFGDTTRPWEATDTLGVWLAGYWNPVFDGTGTRVDSVWVAPRVTLRLTTVKAYQPFEVINEYELGRFITPYGNWFREGIEFVWTFDVTDYAFLLRDSVELRATYDGYSKGSLFSLDFDLIQGTPPRDVRSIDIIYNGYFRYGDPNTPIEDALGPRRVWVAGDEGNTTLRLITSGHGFGGTDDAAEFSHKIHTVDVNGAQRFTQDLWRADCGQNPVYPQAGTWYFHRGGWCPGSQVFPFDYNMTPFVVKGDSATVDYTMQPYVNADPSKPATYIIQAQVLHAGPPNFSNDARLEEIKIPNNGMDYRRMNPTCSGVAPVARITNTGGATLERLTISYGIDGTASNVHQWVGTLGFMESVDVQLPAIDLGRGDHTFTVVLSEPNGVTDEYPKNNTLTSSYSTPKEYSNLIFFQLRTDDTPFDGTTNGIRWELLDDAGNVVRSASNLQDRTFYRDTFRLDDGCYRFIIYDEYIGDGLYPIWPNSVYGNFYLRDDRNRLIWNAQASASNQLASFGDREMISFVVKGEPTGVNDQSRSDLRLRILPNPATDRLMIGVPPGHGLARRNVDVELFSSNGMAVLRGRLDPSGTTTLDVAELPSGVYMVRLVAEGVVWAGKVNIER